MTETTKKPINGNTAGHLCQLVQRLQILEAFIADLRSVKLSRAESNRRLSDLEAYLADVRACLLEVVGGSETIIRPSPFKAREDGDGQVDAGGCQGVAGAGGKPTMEVSR